MRTDLLLQILEYDVEHRYDKKQGKGSDKHTSHDSGTQRRVTVGTRTAREHQRNHTEDHGEHRHQDRTETHLGSRIGRLDKPHALAPALDGKLRNQDGRLGQQADKHNHTGLHVDVVLHSEEFGEEERPEHTERNRKNDGKRYQEALIEAGQNQVNQEDTDGVDEHRLPLAGASLLTRDAAVLVVVARRQHLFGHLGNRLLCLTGRVTVGHIHVDGNGAEQVETVLDFGTLGLGQGNKLAEGRHLGAVAHKHVVQVHLIQTVFGVGLEHHAVHLAELVVVGHVRTTAIAAQHVQHFVGRNTRTHTLGCIHIDGNLREVLGIGGIGHGHFGTLVECAEVLQHGVVEGGHVATGLVLHVQFHRVTHTVARNHRRLEAEYLGVLYLGKLGVEPGHYGFCRMFATLAFTPVFQTDNNHTVRSTLSRKETVTGYALVVGHLGRIGQNGIDLVEHLGCLFQGTARSRADVGHDGTLVFLRHKARLGCIHKEYQQHNGCHQGGPAHPTVVDGEHHTFLIFAQQSGVRSIVSGTHAAVDTLGALGARSGTHQHGTQGGTQRKGANHGQTYGSGHRNTKLRVEDTGRTTHEGYGDEHRHKHTGTRNDGHRNIAHRIFRGEVWRLVA